MFQSKRRQAEIAERTEQLDNDRRKAAEYRRVTGAELKAAKADPRWRDREWEYYWTAQRADHQSDLDYHVRQSTDQLAQAKKRWWQS